MFTASLRSALVALVASAVAVSAAPGLTLTATGPASVDGVENLKVVTTLTNTGDETLKLLNHPSTILNKIATNSFSISTESGANPKFVGFKAKYVPAQAAKSTDEAAFTVLTPGQSIEVAHDLSEAYNFSDSGADAYSIEPSSLFYYVNEKSEPVELHAEVESHVARVAGNLAKAKPAVSRRFTFESCSSSQQSQIQAGASAAQNYANQAFSYLQSHTSATARYTEWFGTYTSSRHSTVQSHFNNIHNNDFTSFTYDCSCTDPGVYAFVNPSDFGHIHFCGAFWQAPTTGTDSKGGTIIHESSHFTRNGGTDDVVYGQTGARQLAKSNPDQAIINADSHEYFAENNPQQS